MNPGFVGFGFGPIQAGLFVPFARADGFDRITVAEIDADLVRAVRANEGAYALNIAHADRLETMWLHRVEILNPFDLDDDRELTRRLREASTVVTALPSPAAYAAGGGASVAARIAAALGEPGPPVVVYTAENHPEAPTRLERAVRERLGGVPARTAVFVGTVIGKMSQIVSGEDAARRRGLAAIAPGVPRAFLVESFDRIISGRVPDACRVGRLSRLIEADDLRPHQELKLYGHNAAHVLLGLVARARGVPWMPGLRKLPAVVEAARRMIFLESGAALRRRWPGADGELASDETLRRYAMELVDRMMNPWLGDAVTRVIRDLPRKLARDDRLFGALAVCDQHGVWAPNLEAAALGGVAVWRAGAAEGQASVPEGEETMAAALSDLWGRSADEPEIRRWAHRLFAARGHWLDWLRTD